MKIIRGDIIKDNFELITHSFDNEITIIPISDVHLGASNCMLKEFKDVVKYIAETPNVYCTLGGDILDNAVIVGKSLGVFDSNMTPMKSIEYAVDILKPIKHKILGVVGGNHEDRSAKVTDINPLYMICCELGIQDLYRPSMAVIKVTIGDRNKKDQCYTILLHHGKGTSESAIKKDHDFMLNFNGVDICITGHTHNGRVAKFNSYYINKYINRVVPKQITIIVTNSFLKDAEYGIKSMLVGASNEIISFDLKLNKEKKVIVHY